MGYTLWRFNTAALQRRIAPLSRGGAEFCLVNPF
jgi:hypothetical protein